MLLLGAVWITVLGSWLLSYMEVSDRPWVTVFESIAQRHVLGMLLPYAVLGTPITVAIASAMKMSARVGE